METSLKEKSTTINSEKILMKKAQALIFINAMIVIIVILKNEGDQEKNMTVTMMKDKVMKKECHEGFLAF